MTTIYALIDPRTKCVRYVGRTRRLSARISHHISPGPLLVSPGPKRMWIDELLALGTCPAVVVIEKCDDEVASARERHWISFHAGPELLNRQLGRPVSTGSSAIPIIQFRVSAAQHVSLQADAERLGIPVNEVAKRRAFPSENGKKSKTLRAKISVMTLDEWSSGNSRQRDGIDEISTETNNNN